MKLFLHYLRSKALKIGAFLLFALLFLVSFRLYHLPLAAVWYPSPLCAALALPALADSVTDSISVCIGYFGWAEDEFVEKAKFTRQELDDW